MANDGVEPIARATHAARGTYPFVADERADVGRDADPAGGGGRILALLVAGQRSDAALLDRNQIAPLATSEARPVWGPEAAIGLEHRAERLAGLTRSERQSHGLVGFTSRTRRGGDRLEEVERVVASLLYVCTRQLTALAEVRAAPGQYVGIGCVRLQRPQRVLDLVHLPHPSTPFFEEDLRWKAEALDLLARFGEELSLPVTEGEAPEQYIVSQRSVRPVREAGFDGVAYPSGRAKDHNVVVFDPTVGRITRRRIVRVQDAPPGFEAVDRPNLERA